MTTKTRAPRQTKNARLKKRMDLALVELAHVELIKYAADGAIEPAYLFKHALVQDTAQSTLLHGEYKRLNGLVATAYETIFADRCMEEYAAVLAQHYDAAGDAPNTLKYATRAGDLAAQVYANAEAVMHYTQALNAAPGLEKSDAVTQQLFGKRGRAFELMGNYDAALANYTEMETEARARGDRTMELAAGMARATILSTPNAKYDPETALGLSTGSLVLARALNDRSSEAKILWNLMLLAHFRGQTAEAIEFGQQSIALARELKLTEQLAYSLNDISRPLMMSGRLAEGIAVLNEAHKLWQTLDNKPMLADNLASLAAQNFNLGEYEQAIALASEAYGIGETIDNPWTQAFSLMTRAFIYSDRGEVERSIEMMQACLRLAMQVGFLVAISSIKNALTLTFAELGDYERGFEIIRALASTNQASEKLEMGSLALRAQLLIRQGELEQARSLIAACYREHVRQVPTPFQVGSTRLADVELALAEQDYTRALGLCDELIQLFGERGVRYYRSLVMYLKGRALFGLDRPQEAEQILQQALADVERVGARRTRWQILALLGEIETRRENQTEAALLFAQARDVLMFIVEHIPAQYRASFLNMPQVRAVMAQAQST